MKNNHLFQCRQVNYKKILHIESLTILKGQLVSVVGPSGSGKTTFLKLFNRMLTPEVGEIFFCGEELGTLNPVLLRRRVVMLPQRPIILPGSIRDNLVLGCQLAQKDEPSNRSMEERLEKMGLKKTLEDSTERLSGGEKQRLSLLRVMLMDPDVLLLDEPSSALDDELELKIIALVKRYVLEKKKSLIMVTHSRSIAAEFTEYSIIIEDGMIRQIKGLTL